MFKTSRGPGAVLLPYPRRRLVFERQSSTGRQGSIVTRIQSSIRRNPTPQGVAKPRRRWQVYLLASLIVLATFIGAGRLFTKTETEPARLAGSGAESLRPHRDEAEDAAPPLQGTLASAATEESAVEEEDVVEVTLPPETEVPVWVGPPFVPGASSEVGEDLDLAQSVVGEFYQSLNRGDVVGAYDKLSREFREALPFERFSQGYSQTQSLTCQIKHSEQVGPRRIRLDVQIAVTEKGVPVEYWATCLVSKSADGWQIAGVAQIKS